MPSNYTEENEGKIFTSLPRFPRYIDLGKKQVKEHSRARFLHLGTVNIWGPVSLCNGGCPVHGRMFRGTPDLYLLEASSSLPASSEHQECL